MFPRTPVSRISGGGHPYPPSTRGKGKDLPVLKKMFEYSFCALCTKNTTKYSFSTHMGIIVLKIFLWTLRLDRRYERMPNALKVFGIRTYTNPPYVVQVLS